MNYADTLRKELNDKNKSIIATEFEPRKEAIMETIAKGIKRIGYVSIDTFNHTGSCEGGLFGYQLQKHRSLCRVLKSRGFQGQQAVVGLFQRWSAGYAQNHGLRLYYTKHLLCHWAGAY